MKPSLRSLGLGLLLAGGCATTSPPARFYQIPSLIDLGHPVEVQPEAPSIGVGPLRLAQYLDRPQLVQGTADGELRVAEFERWAGSLAEELMRVISANLAVQLGSEGIYAYPWPRAVHPDYRLQLEVDRFHPAADRLQLQVRWTLSDGSDTRLLASRIQVLEEPLENTEPSALVAAQGRLLERLAAEMVRVIKADRAALANPATRK